MVGLCKFWLVSADVCGRGMRDESLRVSAWEAKFKPLYIGRVET